nr:NFACT family protein [Lachnospiraceae bacterium]
MAFDGIVIANLVKDLNDKLIGGRISKIYQPEEDELLLLVKSEGATLRLYVSASATLPLFYLVDKNKENPLTAPNFCMLLRKHINGGRIISITQPNFERIVDIEIEHLDEMGDLCKKHLIIEIMGKHSNIIFTDDDMKILDSIKHISLLVSSVREVLPGRDYVFPPSDKLNPMMVTKEELYERLKKSPTTVVKWFYQSLNGMSPVSASELIYRAGIDGNMSVSSLTLEDYDRIFDELLILRRMVEEGTFSPVIVYENAAPKEYSAFVLTSYKEENIKRFDSISKVLDAYYAEKNQFARIRQKSSELRHIVSTAVERTAKKLDIQLKQLKDTDKRDKYKVYGELINTYGYSVEAGAKSMEALNYYTNENITIPLDPDISVSDNAQKYFNRYNKLKRTYEALSVLTKETEAELKHLQSIQVSLDMALNEKDLTEIKEELVESGYMKRHGRGKKVRELKSKPLHYISSDGYHIYVGKNNFQNDEISFKLANAGDLWFHANDIPGSHVIVKLGTDKDVPDQTYEEAARLAAYYSKGRTDSKVEIDYTQRGNIKKPNGAKPGYVIYHTNYSIIA